MRSQRLQKCCLSREIVVLNNGTPSPCKHCTFFRCSVFASLAWLAAHYGASMAMTEREIDGQYAYGWRFGLGFGAAASVYAIVWIVVSVAVANVMIDEQIRQVRTVTKSITTSMKQPKAKTSRVVQIEPESKEVCFERTNGVINEAFQQCVTGYMMTVTD